MRSLGLSFHLAALNAALVCAAVLGVSVAALGLIEGLVEEEALARVRLAAAAAADAVDEQGEAVRQATRLLAERPTLARLASAGEAAVLVEFLEQFREPAGIDGAAVARAGRVLAASPPGVVSAWPRPGEVELRQDGSGVALVASAAVPALPGAETVGLARLDAAFLGGVEARVGVPVRVRAGAGEAGAWSDPTGFVATHPLRGGAGLVEARLPAAATEGTVASIRRRLLLFTAATGLLAAGFGVLLARRLGRPLARLTRAAERIGAGDLGTPVRPAAGREAGTLARAMEEMRGRLLDTTAALRRREAEAQALLAGITEGVLAVDDARRITYLSPQGEALLGVPAAEALGRFCGDVLRPRAVDGVRPCEHDCPIVHARARGPARAVEHLQRRDGTHYPVVVTSAGPVEGRQVQLLRDETEVEAAHRLRDAILANVSHEMRTPLAAQLASLELLRDGLDELSPDALHDLVASMQRGTLRLTRLIDNLLESVRVDAGRGEIRRVAVALDEVVEDAGEFVRPLLDQRRQPLHVDLPYPLPAVRGDPPRLVQVFVNLLANAHKFAPAETPIRIGGAVAREAVSLWVEDEGPGLPAEAGRSLFERFYRGPAGDPEASGLGLGLWIVHSVVTRHGGRAEARSEGGRTRFTITLPREEPA